MNPLPPEETKTNCPHFRSIFWNSWPLRMNLSSLYSTTLVPSHKTTHVPSHKTTSNLEQQGFATKIIDNTWSYKLDTQLSTTFTSILQVQADIMHAIWLQVAASSGSQTWVTNVPLLILPEICTSKVVPCRYASVTGKCHGTMQKRAHSSLTYSSKHSMTP